MPPKPTAQYSIVGTMNVFLFHIRLRRHLSSQPNGSYGFLAIPDPGPQLERCVTWTNCLKSGFLYFFVSISH